MICQNCGTREATALVQTLSGNHLKKLALCGTCVSAVEQEAALDAVLEALGAMRARVAPHRCATCKLSWANFKETGRFGCPNCYEHFLHQVRDLLPRVHAGAYQHRGKTPGRR